MWVIGIGASAGGLEALTDFASSISKNIDACFIVAQHLAPHARSMMVELLGRHSKVPVHAVTDGTPIKAGTLYVVPPNYDVDFKDGHMALTVAGEETRPKPSVDHFFASLARTYGNKAVGIILSGTGSDGSEGIRAIKSAGGIAIVQDDATAKYNGMPNSAVGTGVVDYILSPKEMAERLAEILAHKDHPRNAATDEGDPNFQDILKLIRKEVGTDFSQYKMSTLQRRLARRMSLAHLEKISDYYKKLKSDANELRLLSQEMLVSVTSFFRDQDAFEAASNCLREIVSKKKDGDEVRVWSAGCATGEEAYSFAMILCQHISELGKRISVKVFGTDLDHDAIAHARVGIYSYQDVSVLPASMRDKFFEQKGESYEVSKQIRDMVVFARQDLVQNPPFVKLDFVSCRNVLIYFEPPLQTHVFEIFHYALKPGGILFLGKSESNGNVSHLFEQLDRKAKLYVRKEGAARTLPSNVKSSYAGVDTSIAKRRPQNLPSIADLAQAQILAQHEIAGAVVDDEGAIQSIVGEASDYLEVKAGVTEFRLQNLLPQLAGVELQLLLRRASKSKTLEKSRAFNKADDPAGTSFQIYVKPFQPAYSGTSVHTPSLYLVTFKKVETKVDASPVSLADEGEYTHRVSELEQELAVTREHLQTVIEELGVSNEELQSVNEELSSTNEELQASNEELETTNEELQSTNEELTTLNEELNIRSNELRQINIDLENIQTSIGVPLLAVDNALRLQRFNVNATELFDISFADLGKPIGKVSCRTEINNFEAKIRDTLTNARVNEAIIHSHRNVFQMRILPSRDEKQKVIGAVIVFFNNTIMIELQEAHKKSEARLRAIMNGASSLIFLKDTMGKYLSVNKAFLNLIGRGEGEVLGKSDRELVNDNLATQLRNADLEAMLQRKPVERNEVWNIGGQEFNLLVSRFSIYDDTDTHPYAVGTIAIDITPQVRAHQELSRSESLYRAVVEDQTVYVSRFSAAGEIHFVNTAFAKFFGGSPRDYVGRAFLDMVEPTEKIRVQAELSKITVDRQVVQIEHRISRFGGPTRWLRWIAKGVFSSDGKLSEIQVAGLDVTDYRLQTDQMIQREMLFSNIFTYTTDFLTVFKVVSGNDLILESFNRTVEQGGYSFAQYVGRSIKDLLEPNKKDEIFAIYERCIATQRPQNFDEELNFQAGTRYLATTIIPIINNSGAVERVVALSRDISRYKQAEIELTRAKEAAEVANQSKSDFLASMSHELRSPLNVVLGMAQLLEDAELKTEERKQVESIERSGRVLLALIEDILDLSRIEAGKVKLEYAPFNLNELVRDVMESFELEASRKNIRLAAEVVKLDEEQFIGDRIRIRQILTNLVGNAVKFTDKGSVSVRVSSQAGRGNKKIIRFDVKDTGIGIPKESHSRIFQRFSQVDAGLSRKFGGSGLGLVISKRLTTLMNGRIDFNSEWGRGSHFWFEIPLTNAAHAPRSLADRKAAVAAENQKIKQSSTPARILAVDDNSDSRMVLQMVLKRLGHAARMVESGEDAIKVIQEESYDLVLMDVQMPTMDGYETTMKIRRLEHKNKDIPIVALTANAMVGDSERCFEAGMNDYLTKPFEAETLRLLIEKWMSRKDGAAVAD